MFRPLLTISLILTTAFVLALGAFHLPTQPNGVKTFFQDTCHQPCWQGIIPGETSKKVAMAWFSSDNQIEPIHYPCSTPPSLVCDRYLWVSPDIHALSIEMEIVYGEVGEIDAYSPPFTLGEVMLAMAARHIKLIGAYQSFAASGQFYVQLLFGDTHLSAKAIAPCSGTYLDLLQTPVSDLLIEAQGSRMHNVPVTTFASVRQQFEQLCSG